MNGLKNIYLNKGNYDRNYNLAFFKKFVIVGTESDTCEHVMYKEYENLEKMLNAIKRLQHRPFVIPSYILVEYHGYVFNVTVEDSMKEFSDFLANE